MLKENKEEMTGFQADGIKGEIFVLCCHTTEVRSYPVHKMVPIPENNSLSPGPNPYISPKFAL